MAYGYEIDDWQKEEFWRMFRITGELVDGFDKLSGIQPAVTIYGSARIKPDDELYKQTVEIARGLGKLGFSIVTGGGPGVMEAANKGALEAGAASVGLNIKLPEEQVPNVYTTKSLSFDHFFVRKIMLVKYATAFIMMPGGLGTIDELTEVLTLMQTHKIKPFPIVLFDVDYWNGLLDWLHSCALARGYVSHEDFALLRVCSTPHRAISIVQNWYKKQKVVGKKALGR